MSLYPLKAKTWQQLVQAFVKYPAFHGTLLRHFRMDHLFLVVGQQDIFVLSSGSHPSAFAIMTKSNKTAYRCEPKSQNPQLESLSEMRTHLIFLFSSLRQ